jgi:multidrug resistance protein, MATE family
MAYLPVMRARPDRPHAPGGMGELLAVAIPMVVSNSCETLMMFSNRVFLSWVRPEFMSAAMAGGLTSFMFMTFFLGLAGYSTALVAQHLGAGTPRRCPAVIGQALLISVLAYPIVLLCIPAGHRLFAAAHLAPEQIAPQRQYFDILMYGGLIALLRTSLSGFFSGIGRTRIVMASTALALVVNLVVSYVLIFGRFGLPAMGVRGAAFGTLSGGFAALAVLAAVYFGPAIRREFGVLAGLRPDFPLLRRLLRFGAPFGLEFFLNIMAFNVLVETFHSYGASEAAAMTIAFSWDMVSFVPLLGVNIAVISLVGRHMGAHDPDTAHRTTISALKMALVYSACTFTIFSLFSHPLVEVFRTRQDAAAFALVRPLAVFMVRLVALYVMADAVGIVFGGALRGAGDTFRTMLLTVSGHWALALGGLVLVRVVHAPPRATWLAVVVLVMGVGGALYLRYRTGQWRRIRVLEVPPEPAVPGSPASDTA